MEVRAFEISPLPAQERGSRISNLMGIHRGIQELAEL